jgi:Na+/H+ antiporter NhaD/arsenite permease-like protein
MFERMPLALHILSWQVLNAHEMTDARIAAGVAIFVASYVVFALGKFPGTKIDRPAAAIIGAVLMVALRIVNGVQAIRAVDFATIVLLFSMMLIVGYLRLAGAFDAIAFFIISRLGSRHLLPAVIFTTGVLSAFFVNDIICLVMVPVVLALTDRMRLDPLPYLLAVASASNIGSVATITGNPQNILIGSYSGISYRSFLAHLGPIAVAGLFFDWVILQSLFRDAHMEREEATENASEVSSSVHDQWIKPAMVVLGVLAGFLIGFPPSLVAAVGAAVLLMTRTMEPRHLYEEVDWGLLVFFVGLFIIVAGADQIGVTRLLFDVARHWNLQNPAVLAVVTAVFSNLVSNVPAVMLLKSLIPGFQDPHRGWLILSMASTLAGNLTITGSIANIIVVEQAKAKMQIGFRQYLRAGVPVTICTLAFGTIWLWLTG